MTNPRKLMQYAFGALVDCFTIIRFWFFFFTSVTPRLSAFAARCPGASSTLPSSVGPQLAVKMSTEEPPFLRRAMRISLSDFSPWDVMVKRPCVRKKK